MNKYIYPYIAGIPLNLGFSGIFLLESGLRTILVDFNSWTFMDFWQTLGKIDFSEFEKKNENLNQILKN